MKKFVYTLLAAAAVLAVAACEKEEGVTDEKAGQEREADKPVEGQKLVNPVTMTFSAGTSTKVSISGEGTGGDKTAVWEENDQIKVVWYNTSESTMKSATSTALTAGEAGNASAIFSVTVEDADYYYAVYPSSLTVTLDGEGNMTVNFPNNSAASASFGGAAWYVAKTTKADKSFAFHPISTVIKFTLDGSAVANPEKVYFRSMAGGLHKLHGHAAITFADEPGYPVSAAANDGAGNVTFTVAGEGTYYIPIPGYGAAETTGADGFIFQIQKAGSTIPASYFSGTITQQPGKFYNVKSAIDSKVITNYYVARTTQGVGGGLSQSNAETLANLKANAPAFKYSDKIAGALLLDGTTINILGDASAYTDPLGVFNTNASSPAHSYTIVGGIGGGTTTFTTTSSSTFNNAKATVTLKDITFSGCSAAYGAALSLSAGTLKVRNCKFLDNVATGLSTNGGAIDVSSSGTLYLDKCYFKDNYRQETVGASSGTNSGLGYDIGAVVTTTTLCMHNCTLDNSKLGLNKTTGNKAFLPNASAVQTKGVTLIINSTFKGAGNSGRGCYCIGYNGVADGDPDKVIICNSTLTHSSQPSLWSKATSDAYSLKYDYCLVKSVSLANYPTHIISGEHNAVGAFTMGADSGYGYFAAPTIPDGYNKPTKAQIESYVNSNPAWTAFRTWLGDEWGKDQAGNSRGTDDSSVWTPGSIQ